MIFNVGMSKPPKVASRPAGGLRGAVRAPAGYGAAPRSKKCVSKMKKYVDHQVLHPANVLGTYKLLTDDFPIVQAF